MEKSAVIEYLNYRLAIVSREVEKVKSAKKIAALREELKKLSAALAEVSK